MSDLRLGLAEITRLDRATVRAVLAKWDELADRDLASLQVTFDAWLRAQAAPGQPGRRLPSSELLDRAHQLYLEAGSYAEVARQLGIAETTAKRWAEAGRRWAEAAGEV